MTSPRTVKITELPASTQDLNDTDSFVAVQPYGSSLLTVKMPASKILAAARTAGAASASANGMNFVTLADAQASVLLTTRLVGATLTTSGYTTAGDGGGAVYQKVATEPSHAGKFQDLDGDWWELKVPELAPEMFGAIGDGVTNDTVAMQAAIDALGSGDALVLRNGATYLVDNLTQPQLSSNGITIYSNGIATIKANNAGNSNYLFASTSYVNNLTYATWPLRMENIIIDANNVKNIGLALATAFSRIVNCRFVNALVDGCYLTETTINGTTNCPSVVDNTFLNCTFDHNVNGLHVSNLVADYKIIGANVYLNTGYGFKLDACGGLQMATCTTYQNTTGHYFAGYGFNCSVIDCNFDDDIEIASLDGTNKNCQFGPANTIKDHVLTCLLSNAASNIFFSIDNCRFQGTGAHLLHNYNSTGRVILLNGGSSEATQPVQWGFANPTGIVIAKNHWNKNANGFLNGRLYSNPSTFTGAQAANSTISVLKNLNVDTSTAVSLTLSLPTSQSSGSAVRLKMSVLTIQTSFTSVGTYTGNITGAFYRQIGSSRTANHVLVHDEAYSTSAAISATATWSSTGGASDQVATLNITLAHPLPSAAGQATLRVDVEADHRFTTAMTLA